METYCCFWFRYTDSLEVGVCIESFNVTCRKITCIYVLKAWPYTTPVKSTDLTSFSIDKSDPHQTFRAIAAVQSAVLQTDTQWPTHPLVAHTECLRPTVLALCTSELPHTLYIHHQDLLGMWIIISNRAAPMLVITVITESGCIQYWARHVNSREW